MYVSAVPNLLENLISVLNQFFHLRVSVGGKTPNDAGHCQVHKLRPAPLDISNEARGLAGKIRESGVSPHENRYLDDMLLIVNVTTAESCC